MKPLTVGGTELWFEERGAGVPLLLVHGFPLDHTMWTTQIEAISSRCRVIAPDLPGFGRSPPAGDKTTMDQFADDLAGLLDALGISEPVVYCGLSMGGYIGWQFWRKHANRLRGLILCDTRATADSPEAVAGRHEMVGRVLREGPKPVADAMLPRLVCEATRRRQPKLVEAVRNTIMANDPRGIAAAALGMAERPDMTAALGRIRCPTLVIVGREDVISPPTEMRDIAAAIPGCQVRGDSRRRPPLADREPRGGQRRDWRVPDS